MSWLDLQRQPEPEVMNDADEVDSYASAAAQRYLDAIDNTLVEQVLGFGGGRGRLLDVGSGPGGILLKLCRRSPELRGVGVDRSPNMVRAALAAARDAGLAARVSFLLADASRLPFLDESFDTVISNSVLHHLSDPGAVFNELGRLLKPGGCILVRDLRRPGRLAFRLHVAWFGRYYSGLMRKLYVASTRAAYTAKELEALLEGSRLAGAGIFFHKRTHLGFVWRAEPASTEQHRNTD